MADLQNLTNAQVQALTIAALRNSSTDQNSSLTPTQMVNLTTVQVNKLTGD